jgi:hypothetical protein
MNSQPVALVGQQSPQILHAPHDIASLAEADDCIEYAESYGYPLDEAQKITLRTWMGTRSDGTWSASRCGHACSRQNGKGDEIEAREAFGLDILGERIIHTSHEIPTSIDAFERLLARFTNYDDLRKKVRKVSRVNGMQGLTLRSGAEIKYRARTSGGARGLTNMALIVYDEAQHLQRKHLGASSATKAVHPNPQSIFTGSAGFEFSEPWWDMRLEAIKGGSPRLGYVEHTAEAVGFDANGRFFSVKPDPTDRAEWARANPTYNRRISDEFLSDQLRDLGPEMFSQEHLGVWLPMPSMLAQAGAKIPEAAWRDTGTAVPYSPKPGEVVLAYDVEVDASWAAISVAYGDLASGFVETIEHRAGVGWLPSRLVELVRDWLPRSVLLDGGSGAAAAILGEVRVELERAGLSPDTVEALPSSAYKAACSSFLEAVRDGKVHRPIVDNDRLEEAGLIARARDIGDAWVFDRRNSPGPIVALTSAAMARSRLSEPADVFVGGFHDLNDY